MKISSRIARASIRLLYLATTAATLGALLAPTGAQASIVTVGSPMSATLKEGVCVYPEGCTTAHLTLPEQGATPTSPVNGAIVRWRIGGATAVPGYAIRVLKSSSATSFTGAGTSSSVTPAGSGTETFKADLPIHAGEYIGLNIPGGGKIGYAETGATYAFIEPELADGATASSSSDPGEVAFNADVLPSPTIAAISPSSGSVTGGSSVVITGTNLAEVKDVSFNSAPAVSFTVNSETQITAVAPPSPTPGAVDTSVTTVAGTTSIGPADQFTYTACVVPKLKGKKLKAARKTLKKADCTLGKVRGHKTKSAKVVKQSPKPGKVLAPGSKVSVKVK